MLGDVGGQADVDAAIGERQCQPGSPDESAGPAPGLMIGCVHLARVGLDTDVMPALSGECRREVSGPAADVEHAASGGVGARPGAPQVGDHGGGVIGQRAVEARGVGLFEAELAEQSSRAPSVARRANRSVTAIGPTLGSDSPGWPHGPVAR